jgi:hypothetical protein
MKRRGTIPTARTPDGKVLAVKKILLALAAAAVAVLAKRQLDKSNAERTAWAKATDRV